MDTIRYFKLSNKGGFVTRIHVRYRNEGEENWKEWSGSGDICIDAERTQDLKDLGIANGTHVNLLAFVVWGSDHTASEEYIFSSESGKTASYEISGTTLINHLKLISCG